MKNINLELYFEVNIVILKALELLIRVSRKFFKPLNPW